MSNSSNQLYFPSFTISIGGNVLNLIPRIAGNLVFLEVKVNSVIGTVDSLISMDRETFRKLTILVSKYQIIPKLSDIIEGTFNERIVIKR